MGRPASSWRTLGFALFMRVPCPAARRTAASASLPVTASLMAAEITGKPLHPKRALVYSAALGAFSMNTPKSRARHAWIPKTLKHASAAALLLGAMGAAQGCNSIDTTRIAPPKATLGDDLFGLMCDRVGASSFTEDLAGGSYYGICHYDDAGNYKDALDASYLPPVTEDAQIRARNLS